MTIIIVAATNALQKIQQSFESKHCVGVQFEYYDDPKSVLASIETRGFSNSI